MSTKNNRTDPADRTDRSEKKLPSLATLRLALKLRTQRDKLAAELSRLDRKLKTLG